MTPHAETTGDILPPPKSHCENPMCDGVIPDCRIIRRSRGTGRSRRLKCSALCEHCGWLMTATYAPVGVEWVQIEGTIERKPKPSNPICRLIARRLGEIQIASL